MSTLFRRAARPLYSSSSCRNGLRSVSTISPFGLPPNPSSTQHLQHPDPPRAFTPMPYVTETIGGGWHTYDIYSRLLKERIVCLNGGVDDVVSANIVAQLLFLEADAPEKPISLYINSPGGSVSAGLAIYDTMTYIRSPVHTICMGMAASMGAFLLAGGEAGNRFCLPNSSVMIHQPSGGYSGTAADVAIHAKEILRTRERLNRILQKHLTKEKSIEDIEKSMERDYYMDAREALDFGIVDRILERRENEEAEKK